MKVSSLDPKYVKMIQGVASDIVFKIEADAMRYAWNSLPIPTEKWELDVSTDIEVLVLDILADKANEYSGALRKPTTWAYKDDVKFLKMLINWFKGKPHE